MAWSAPMTAVANTAFTAAAFNTHVRDNLLETAPAKATAAGRFFATTGANAIAERVPATSGVLTAETTTSTSFVDLTSVGPAVTVTTGPVALVTYGGEAFNSGTGFSYIDVAVSGDSTVAASVDTAFAVANNSRVAAMTSRLITGLTPGSNTFTAKYAVSAGTGTFRRRRLTVFPL